MKHETWRPTRRDVVFGAAAIPALAARTPAKDVVRILEAPSNGIQPRVVLAGDVLHLIYFTGEARHGDVFYTRSNDLGASFATPVRVNSQPGSAIATGTIRGAQIALGKGSRVHVAWNGSDLAEPKGVPNREGGQPGSAMLYARLNERGSGFEPQRNLMRTTFGLDGGGSIAADRGGKVWVGWHGKAVGARAGEAGRQIWIARSDDEGQTFASERVASQEPTGACGCCGMRLFADSRGVLHGLFRSARENEHRDIYALRSGDGGTTFTVALLHPWNINACPMTSMDLIEAGDDVLGAWETQTQIYFAPLNRGVDAAKAAMLTPPGNNPKRKYPVLARNRRGETLAAWVEGAGWQRSGVLGWQLFDREGRPTAAGEERRNVPVWSFPAVFARPDEGFTVVV